MLLLVAFGWVRSHWLMDALTWTDGRRFVTLLSGGGRLNLTESVWPNGTAWSAGWAFSSTSRAERSRLPLWEVDPDIYGRRRFLGFEWSNDLSPWPSDQNIFESFYVPPYRLIAVPYWAEVVLLALPLVGPILRASRRRRRLRDGRCPECAYDLRGTPAGCPECGWASPSPPAGASAPAPIVPM